MPVARVASTVVISLTRSPPAWHPAAADPEIVVRPARTAEPAAAEGLLECRRSEEYSCVAGFETRRWRRRRRTRPSSRCSGDAGARRDAGARYTSGAPVQTETRS